ncbi:sensor histidine kinase [Ornithinimicrobium sp. LYQ121]|uniref:sensor histidine kinase n=1 Tax=Ornithinimicrobium sp. LYQ121 TaxID=3378801 RepID=UPI003852D75E
MTVLTRLTAGALAAGVVVTAAAAAALAPTDVPWKLVLVASLWAVPGALIAADRPRNPVGWLVLLAAGMFATAGLATAWLESGHRTAAPWAAWATDRASALIVPATLLVLLLLPDGRLPSRRWRPVVTVVLGAQLALISAWALLRGPAPAPDTELPGWTASLTNPVGVLPSAWTGVVTTLEPWLLTGPLVLAAGAIAHRISRGWGDERRRLTDVLAAAMVFLLCVVVGQWVWPAASGVLDVAGAALLAGSLVSAVLRRHMRRAAIVVGHALVYSTLSALAALTTVSVLALLRSSGVDVPPLAVGLVAAVVAVAQLPLGDLLRRALRRLRNGPGPDDEELVTLLEGQLLQSRHEMVAAREDERAALRRELHDVLGPTLAGLTMQLGVVAEIVRTEPDTAAERLARLEDASRRALDDVRRLSRGLRPPGLDELGLLGALRDLAERQGVDLVVRAAPVPALPASVEVAAYRIGSEAITNAARHSGAQRVEVSLEQVGTTVVVRVADAGCGTRSTRPGVGTLSMRERATELGGRLTIRDTEGGGTTVEARLPLSTVPT